MFRRKGLVQSLILFVIIEVMSELAIHTNVANREKYACLVLKKAQRLGLKVAVLFDDENLMDDFDNLLWTFEPSAFIPHAIAGTAGAVGNAYILSSNPNLLGNAEMLVLLTNRPTPAINDLMQKYPKMIDIVPQQDPGLTDGRKRFVAYRKYGITPVVHKRN